MTFWGDMRGRAWCPKCGEELWRDEVDVGVGILKGPWGCPRCAWSESSEYDLSSGKNPVNAQGGVTDQYGGYHPPGSTLSLAERIAHDDDLLRRRFVHATRPRHPLSLDEALTLARRMRGPDAE